ncbi:MAG: hypothetical protein ACE5F8_04110 [Woeseiaceae bacterium]
MHQPHRKPGVGWLSALLLAACGQQTEPPPPQESDAPATRDVASREPPAVPPAPDPPIATDAGCGDRGAFNVTLYGALAGDIQWRADDMICQGMSRPEGAGARLRFAGKAGDPALAIAFIIAIPALERGATATELPTVVTVIEEGKGRFFSTPDLDSCWTDVASQSIIDEANGRSAIDGRLYCISPIPEVQGDASVSIQELSFSGLLDWDTD